MPNLAFIMIVILLNILQSSDLRALYDLSIDTPLISKQTRYALTIGRMNPDVSVNLSHQAYGNTWFTII